MKIAASLLILLLTAPALAFETTNTSTGHTLISEVQDTPYQYLTLVFPLGSAEISPEKQGTLKLLGEVLNLGPADQSTTEFRRYKFLNNVSLEFDSSDEHFFVTLKFQKESAGKSLELLKRILEKPMLTLENFQERRKAMIASAAGLLDNAQGITSYFADKIMRSESHEALSGRSTPLTLKKVELADIKNALAKLKLEEASLYSFGPMGTSPVKMAFAKILPPYKKRAQRNFQTLKKVVPAKGYLLQKAGATDNQILLVKDLNIKPYSEEFARAEIALRVLGGGMSSRLMQALRVKGGLTYSARSWVQRAGANQSQWSVSTFGGISQFPKLLDKIPKLINTFVAKGVTESEIDEVRKLATTGFKQRYELPFDLFRAKMRLHLRGLPVDYPENYLGYIRKIKAKSLNVFIKKNFSTQGLTLFAHGDKAKVLKSMPKGSKVVNIKTIP